MSILIENVSKQFNGKTVLESINLEIKTGSLVALLGGSGSGKSTLLRVVAGFELPDSGRIWLHGTDSRNVSVQEKEIGFVFQAYALFQHLTVYENIAFGHYTRSFVKNNSFLKDKNKLVSCEPRFSSKNSGSRFISQQWSNSHKKKSTLINNRNTKSTNHSDKILQHQQEGGMEHNGSDLVNHRVEELLRVVELEDFAHRYPAQLSGGQCQRVALARALAVEPKVLLLDEPFGALDQKVRKQLRRWLRQLHEKVGVTTLFVTHDYQEAMEVANEIVVLEEGRVKHSLQQPKNFYNKISQKKV